MGRFLKRDDFMLGSPHETLGFSKDFDLSQVPAFQNFFIKKFDFRSLEQLHDVKRQLMARKILILNLKELLQDKSIPVDLLKRTFDDLKLFLNENGGSIGRLGEYYLILTPNSNVRMGF